MKLRSKVTHCGIGEEEQNGNLIAVQLLLLVKHKEQISSDLVKKTAGFHIVLDEWELTSFIIYREVDVRRNFPYDPVVVLCYFSADLPWSAIVHVYG